MFCWSADGGSSVHFRDVRLLCTIFFGFRIVYLVYTALQYRYFYLLVEPVICSSL